MMTSRSLLAGLLIGLCASVASGQDTPVDKGKQVYDYWCATCHGPGRGKPGTIALAAKYKGSDRPALLEDRTDLTAQGIRLFVRNGVSIMPMFRKTEISDADLDAMAAFLTRRSTPPPGAPATPRQP